MHYALSMHYGSLSCKNHREMHHIAVWTMPGFLAAKTVVKKHVVCKWQDIKHVFKYVWRCEPLDHASSRLLGFGCCTRKASSEDRWLRLRLWPVCVVFGARRGLGPSPRGFRSAFIVKRVFWRNLKQAFNTQLNMMLVQFPFASFCFLFGCFLFGCQAFVRNHEYDSCWSAQSLRWERWLWRPFGQRRDLSGRLQLRNVELCGQFPNFHLKSL